MTPIFSAILIGLWLGVLIPVTFLVLECAAALAPSRAVPTASSLDDILVLIPAYNEEAALPRCLASLLDDGLVANQIVVVANDCADRTVEVAHTFGVQVIEHHNPRL